MNAEGEGYTNRELNALLNPLISKGSAACLSIALWRDDRIVYHYVKGTHASVQSRKKITKNTPFNIGSVTKVITALLVLRMEELGLLSLQDKIATYLPNFPHPDITLEQMMIHTAGFDTIRIVPWPKFGDTDTFAEQLMPLLKRQYEPGTKSVYFPHGYFYLMKAIEQARGQTIERIAQRELFQPLGMKHTTYDMSRLKPKRYVLPCAADMTKGNLQYDQLAATGDSSLYSTSEDLLQLAQALLNGGSIEGRTVLSRQLVHQALSDEHFSRFHRTLVFYKKGEGNTFPIFAEKHSPSTVAHIGFTGCMLWIDPENKTAGTIISNLPIINHADVYATINNALLNLKV